MPFILMEIRPNDNNRDTSQSTSPIVINDWPTVSIIDEDSFDDNDIISSQSQIPDKQSVWRQIRHLTGKISVTEIGRAHV